MTNTKEETRIRAVIDDWADAMRAKDAARVLSHGTNDMVHFSLAPPLIDAGSGAADLQKWFDTWQGPIGYEFRDLKITADDDVAYCHCLNRMTGTQSNGKTELWFRHTLCFRKIGDQWKIAHAHESVPFYMDGSFKAAVDLTP